jgi:hypothetical protein
VSLAIAVSAGPARAEDADAGIRMAARELALSGADAFDKQDYVTALDRFQRAEALYRAPSIAVMVARCLARVGRVVEAVDKYEATRRIPLEANAPDAFHRAVADANAEVDAVKARVARLQLRLPADAPPSTEVRLDDRPVPAALLGVDIPVDPGAHRVVARASGRAPYHDQLVAAEGGRHEIQISLPVESAAVPMHESSRDSRGARPPTLAIALLVGGGVALAGGAVTGIVALGHKSNLDKNCSPGCPAKMEDELDGFRLNRTLSYVGFGVGLAAAGAGTYFLLHRGASGEELSARVFPGGAAVAGRF